MNCTSCGALIETRAKFCRECGTGVDTTPEATSHRPKGPLWERRDRRPTAMAKVVGVAVVVLLVLFILFLVGALIAALGRGGLNIGTFLMLLGTIMFVGVIVYAIGAALVRQWAQRHDE